LAQGLVQANGGDAEGARHLLTLTSIPRGIYAYAGVAAMILVTLVTLATLRS